MAIKPYKGSQRRLRFRSYDLEWYPENLEVRIVGEYGQDRGLTGYQPYLDVRAFLRSALTHENSGLVWFAHCGGLYDVQFLAELLACDKHYRLSAAFSGSSVIILKVSEAEGQNSWTFCDSFWLIRESLANLAPMTGRQKGGKEYRCNSFPACGHEEGKCIFYAPIPILTEYNSLDCQILWEAIDILQERLLDLGGALKKTIASCALHLFRSRYLTREIETSDAVNLKAREGYIASRVEVYRKACGPAYYYDINSSFPASMTSPQPGEIIGFGHRIPDDGIYMVDADIRVPECYLPPLPRRSKGRVFFPTGRWRGHFFPDDIRLLEETGGGIDRVHRVTRFAPLEDFAAYVYELYELKRTATDPATRQIAKYLLNAHYGKYAENPVKQQIVVRPKKTSCPHGGRHIEHEAMPDGTSAEFSTCMTQISPSVWSIEAEADVPHQWVPISANITAESRARQYRNIRDASERGKLYYGDTDSTITGAELDTGDLLGELKVEHKLVDGEFLAPKLYRIRTESGKVLIKAKGFHSLTSKQFDVLREGGSLEYDHFCRIRERLNRDKVFGPKQETRSKRLLNAKPKRAWLENGDTRPWTVEEIEREEA